MSTDSASASQSSPAAYDPAKYDRPSVTVDIVLFTYRDDGQYVLLVRRKRWPYADHWALPGGFIDMNETLEESAQRELLEETGISGVQLEQLHTFGNPGRDPRTRVISVAYVGVLDADASHDARGGDDAAEARWWPLHSLPPLAFDHDRILACARRRISQQA